LLCQTIEWYPHLDITCAAERVEALAVTFKETRQPRGPASEFVA
jgi:hypothetical protein